MKRDATLRFEFVEYVPDALEDGTIYVSMKYATAAHKCCCGCGGEVVTPISPTDWQLTFDGESISLYPSIGNWGFDCRSHYWIKRNRVVWAPRWSKKEIDAGRARDRLAKKNRFEGSAPTIGDMKASVEMPEEAKPLRKRKRELKKIAKKEG